MDQFEKIFRSSSTLKLLKVVAAPEDYSAEAFAAAKAELEGRTDVAAAQALLAEEKARDKVELDRQEAIKGSVGEKARAALDLVNPIQPATSSGEKRVKQLVLLFGILSIYILIKEFPIVQLLFSDDGGSWDWSVPLYLLPLLILPIGTYLLFKRRRFGWGMLYAWSIVNCTGSLTAAVVSWGYSRDEYFDTLFLTPYTPPALLLVGGLLVGGLIFALLNRQVRGVLEVDRTFLLKWTVIGAVLPVSGWLM